MDIKFKISLQAIQDQERRISTKNQVKSRYSRWQERKQLIWTWLSTILVQQKDLKKKQKEWNKEEPNMTRDWWKTVITRIVEDLPEMEECLYEEFHMKSPMQTRLAQ